MIYVKNLTLGYENKDRVIDGISFHLPKGEVTTIIGANGCGKSTLLKAMTRCLKPSTGSIELMGQQLDTYATKQLARRMAALPQSPKAPDDCRVYDLVAQGRFPHLPWHGHLTHKDKEIVHWAMEAAKIEGYSHRVVSTLSGGERQRVFVAMALAQQPEVLFLDEPTTHLDIAHQFEVLELIQRLNRDLGLTIVMVLHDLNQAMRYAHEMIVLNKGKVYAKGRGEDIMTAKLCEDVFGIEVDIFRDEARHQPIVIPIGSRERIES